MTAPFCVCPRARHEHGTLACYSAHACRCQRCVRVHSRWLKTSQHRRDRIGVYTPATFLSAAGTARRLQALAVCGWSADDLAPLTGMHPPNLVRLRREYRPLVTAATAAVIRRVYDEVWDQPPTGRYAVKVRNLALKSRWLPPLAWDEIDDPNEQPADPRKDKAAVDEVAVERAIAGQQVHLTQAERHAAIVRMTAAGYGFTPIMRTLGVSGTAIALVRRELAAA